MLRGISVRSPGRYPPSLVDDVLESTGRREHRVRLLPARVVVYFVLAMALFSTDFYHGVWASLVKGLGGVTARIPSTPALSQTRARLGAAPMAELFARLSGPVATTATPGAFWHMADLPSTASESTLVGSLPVR